MTDKQKNVIESIKAWGLPGAIATFVSIVFLSGATLTGYIGLPERVDVNEAMLTEQAIEIYRLHEDDTEIKAALREILCNQDPDKTWEQCRLEYGSLSAITAESPGNK